MVAGSNPAAGAIFLYDLTARWCNGSTTDSGSVCLGSNPGRAAIFFLMFLAIVFVKSKTNKERKEEIINVEGDGSLPKVKHSALT